MDLNTKKEEFSKAYLRAVGVMADSDYLKPETDRDSIDVCLKRVGGLREQLDIQLKCTDQDIPSSGNLTFDLPLKNYNDLRASSMIPSLLVVVFVPKDTDDWLSVSEEELVMKKCGWWLSLADLPATSNKTTVRVTLARGQLLTPEALTALFDAQTGTAFQPA